MPQKSEIVLIMINGPGLLLAYSIFVIGDRSVKSDSRRAPITVGVA